MSVELQWFQVRNVSKKQWSCTAPMYVNVYIYTTDVNFQDSPPCSSLIKDDCCGNYGKGKENQGLPFILVLWSLIAWNNGTGVFFPLHTATVRHTHTSMHGCAGAHTHTHDGSAGNIHVPLSPEAHTCAQSCLRHKEKILHSLTSSIKAIHSIQLTLKTRYLSSFIKDLTIFKPLPKTD